MTSDYLQEDRSALMECKLDPRKGRLHVEIKSDVTSSCVGDLRKGLLEIFNEQGMDDWKFLYLDMRNSRMVDSMGMNWLFAENVRLSDHGKKLVVRISSPAIHRVMLFTGLDKLVTLKYRRRKQTR